MSSPRRAQRRLVLLLGAASLACAPVPPEGESVHISEESAIIIWDADAKTQHFIRRAAFQTKAKDFGFLVPTPTVPKLEEAEDAAFGYLEKVTAPAVIVREVPGLSEVGRNNGAGATAAIAVTVMAEAKVAGYDAVVLEARDADALNRWLKEHGYASSPELVDWFKPYIERNWKISAFKIARENPGDERTSSKAVRMSFQTDAPFFPYREPATQRTSDGAKSRMLRVFVLADARFGGNVGANGRWPGKTVWSGQISDVDRTQILERVKLPQSTASEAKWLTEFEDHSSPRPGTDEVFFRVATDQSAVKRPDTIVYRYVDGGADPSATKSSLSDIAYLIMFVVSALGIVAALFGAKLFRARRSR